MTTKAGIQRIGLGGGCHWCTEGVFQSLRGVTHVDQGWISPDGKETSFSEGVLVEFDPQVISLQVIIEIHLLTHSSQSNHQMRSKYRSGIYVYDQQQKDAVSEIIRSIQIESNEKYITQVLSMDTFKRNKPELLNYFQSKPEAPFCTNYIEPKLKALVKSHKKYLEYPNTMQNVKSKEKLIRP